MGMHICFCELAETDTHMLQGIAAQEETQQKNMMRDLSSNTRVFTVKALIIRHSNYLSLGT